MGCSEYSSNIHLSGKVVTTMQKELTYHANIFYFDPYLGEGLRR